MAAQRTTTSEARISELIEKYSGIGKTFRVKYVGSEDIGSRNDEKLMATTMKNMRAKRKKQKEHKPKVTLSMSVKGISLVEDGTQARSNVTITNIALISLDADDQQYFGMIVTTKSSKTGYKLYVFKTDKSVAIEFVISAQELIIIVNKMLEEKKRKRREEKAAKVAAKLKAEAKEEPKETEETEEPKMASPSKAAEKDSMVMSIIRMLQEKSQERFEAKPSVTQVKQTTAAAKVTENKTPEATNTPDKTASSEQQKPLQISERRQKTLAELLKLESELNDIFQDIMAGKEAES